MLLGYLLLQQHPCCLYTFLCCGLMMKSPCSTACCSPTIILWAPLARLMPSTPFNNTSNTSKNTRTILYLHQQEETHFSPLYSSKTIPVLSSGTYLLPLNGLTETIQTVYLSACHKGTVTCTGSDEYSAQRSPPPCNRDSSMQNSRLLHHENEKMYHTNSLSTFLSS